MKKIFAILLVVACMFSVVSCNLFGPKEEPEEQPKDRADIVLFNQMLKESVPTQAVTVVEQKLGRTTFESTYTLTTGTVAGKAATTLESKVQTLKSVQEGNTEAIETTTEYLWYLEGKGISENRGRKWDPEGTNFAPKVGTLIFNLKSENFEEIEYDEEKSTLYLTVLADKSTEVLKNFLAPEQVFEYDAFITITAAGGRIISITVEYTIPGDVIGDIDNLIDVEEIEVVISTTYSYGLQEIDMD
jgi:predicted small lipoprotein YifL